MIAPSHTHRTPWLPGGLVAALSFAASLPALSRAEPFETLPAERGYDPAKVALPAPGEVFPQERLRAPKITKLTDVPLFPEGPSYRPADGSYFFAGNIGLTRFDPKQGSLHVVVEKPGGGGTHLLPDGSILLVGKSGLRRIHADGRIALIADGVEIGGGNDLTVGIHGEIYFSVPGKGIYRVTPGVGGKVERVTQKGANGLDVDPAGRFLYAHSGSILRYAIGAVDEPLGEAEEVFRHDNARLGGPDGCTFDAWGNLYSMHFKSGTITVLDPEKREVLAEIPTGVQPAANLCFAGPDLKHLFVLAGAPKFENCQLLRIDLGLTGFCGHRGATEYPVLRWLEDKADEEALAALPEPRF